MFPDINSILGIHKAAELEGKLVTTCSSNVDGSFLIHHFVTMFLKQGHPVCFLSLAQSFSHYSAVALKLGVNLKSAQEKGQLTVIEGLKLFRTDQYKNVNSTDSQTGANIFDFVNGGSGTLQSMYNILKQSYSGVTTKDNCPLLIIDDISILTSLGVQAKQIIALLHYLKSMVSIATGHPGFLVTQVTNDHDIGDEVSSLVWRWACHQSDVTIHVYGLESGFCKEVHGEMAVSWPNTIERSSNKIMQFVIQDKSVSLFAPGTSSAVL